MKKIKNFFCLLLTGFLFTGFISLLCTNAFADNVPAQNEIEADNSVVNTVSVTGISLDKTSLSLFVGDTATLNACVSPDNADNKNLIWSSNNVDVATVDNGVITAVSKGIAIIKATTEDGSFAAECYVSVAKVAATIGDTKYASFGQALSAAHEGESADNPTKIVIEATVYINTTIPQDRYITIDLNGNLLCGYFAYQPVLTVDGSWLEIIDSRPDVKNYYYYNKNNSYSISFSSSQQDDFFCGGVIFPYYGDGILVQNGGSLVMDHGTILCDQNDYPLLELCDDCSATLSYTKLYSIGYYIANELCLLASSNCTMTVNNCSIVTNGLGVMGSGKGCKITLNNSTINATDYDCAQGLMATAGAEIELNNTSVSFCYYGAEAINGAKITLNGSSGAVYSSCSGSPEGVALRTYNGGSIISNCSGKLSGKTDVVRAGYNSSIELNGGELQDSKTVSIDNSTLTVGEGLNPGSCGIVVSGTSKIKGILTGFNSTISNLAGGYYTVQPGDAYIADGYAAFSDAAYSADGYLWTVDKSYSVSVSTCEHGTIAADYSYCRAGTKVKVTAIAETGYQVDKIWYNGTEIIPDNGYYFTMPETDAALTASFKTVETAYTAIGDEAYIDSTTRYVCSGDRILEANGLGLVAAKVKNDNPDSEVKVSLIVTKIDKNSADAGKAAIEAEINKLPGYTDADTEYFNFSLQSAITTTGTSSGTITEDITETQTLLELVISYDMTNKTGLQLYRCHNSKAELLSRIYDLNNKGDGTYFVEGSGSSAKIHIFADKFCVFAASAVDIPACMSNAEYAATLTLYEKFQVNLVINNISDGFDKAKLRVNVDGYDISQDKITYENGKAVCILTNKAAADIGENISIRVYYNDVGLKGINYSVAKYCSNVFNSYSSEDKLYSLCEAIVNYGTYAADYRYENDSTLNAGHVLELDTELAKYGGFAEVSETGFTKDAYGISSASANLTLNENLSLNFYITSTKALTADSITVKNSDGEVADDLKIEISGTECTMTITNIGASRLSKFYSVYIGDNKIFTYGVYSYCKLAVDSSEPDITDLVKKICKAIYIYGHTAAEYSASKGQEAM